MTTHDIAATSPAFTDLGLSAKVLSSVYDAGYTQPTLIQSAAIPPILEHHDVLGIAQTGTGKTASFVLPMLTLLENGRARIRMPRTLILAPTRELAAQIADNFSKYGKQHRLNIALLIGGVRFEEQQRKLERGADVLIATPGRLLDHYERGKLLLTGVEILVIDEADRMLDMGFIPAIERICKLLPMTRQTLFFSATMPQELENLAGQFLHNPQRVEVAAASSAALTISQYLVQSAKKPWDKRRVLRTILQEQGEKLKNAIIFCNRKRDVAELSRSLQRHGFSVGALHGDMDQRSRMSMLDNFRSDKIKLLVASDVAARGLDIPEVSHVFNFDVPIHAEDYVHRIGRTGRAGRTGQSFTIVTSADAKALAAIENIIEDSIPYLKIDTGNSASQSQAAHTPAAQHDEDSKQNTKSDIGKRTNLKNKTLRTQKNRRNSIAEEEKHTAAKTEQAEESSLVPTEEMQQKQQPQEKTAAARVRRQTPMLKKNNNNQHEKIIGFGEDMPAFMRIPI